MNTLRITFVRTLAVLSVLGLLLFDPVCTDLCHPNSFLPRRLCVQHLVLPCLLHGRLAVLYVRIHLSVTNKVGGVKSGKEMYKIRRGKGNVFSNLIF